MNKQRGLPGRSGLQCFRLWLQERRPGCAQRSSALPWALGNLSQVALFRNSVPHPSVCRLLFFLPLLLPASALWLELYEAEDNLGLISVPGRHVTCAAGTQTARVLAANSSRERTEGLSHLITGNGSLCVCDSVRLSDRF